MQRDEPGRARLADKVVLVIGATSGIGAAVVRRAAAEGAAVVAVYRRLLGASADRPAAELAAPNPTGRVAAANEIAGLVTFLLSDGAAFITGAAVPIDGGATAR